MTSSQSTQQRSWVAVVVTCVACLVTGFSYATPADPETDAQQLSARPEVTYSGFQKSDNGDGVVFVHVTEKTGIAVKHEGTRVKVRLHGAVIKGRNNLYPLDLSQFNLLILSSRLALVEGEVELQLELRREAHLDTRWVERPDGAASLHVILPRL